MPGNDVRERPCQIEEVAGRRLYRQIVNVARHVKAYRYRRSVHPSDFEDGVGFVAGKLLSQ